ncbi:ferric reductase-like transmembrane domain-containing protein [bacterium]|nr:ferric reductase-like transmembrane domain-containing protein [bacterium]
MLDDVISATISLAVALVVAVPLAPALRRHPAPFYLVAALSVAVYVRQRLVGGYVAGTTWFVDMIQKAYLSCALLAVVMLVGALPEGSALRRRLQPVRGELSILSFILMTGHVAAFLPAYLPRLGQVFASHRGLGASFVVAALLVAVFALLTVTSLRVVRARMPHGAWKAVQRLSYLMVALLYAHILLTLGRTALASRASDAARLAIAVYTALLVAYAVARVGKALRDHRRLRAAINREGLRK